MNFSFNAFSTFAGTPMGIRIIFCNCKCMDMRISRSQFKTAMDAELIFPILGVLACCVGLDICYSRTSITSSPMAGFVCMYDILVDNFFGTLKSTIIANLITIRSVGVCVRVYFLMTSCADFPVGLFIGKHFSGCFVSVFQNISAGFARFHTTIGESVLSMTDPTTTIGTAGPVIEIIITPIVA